VLSARDSYRINGIQGFVSGGIILGFDAAGNILSEFLPDLKKLVHHKK
jgi:hypothetical protein